MNHVTTRDALWGAACLVLGTMLLGGLIQMPLGAGVLGIGLLIAGLLMIIDAIPGSTVVGASMFVAALLLLVTNPIGTWLGMAMTALGPIVAGAVLLLTGFSLVLGRGHLFSRTSASFGHTDRSP